MPVAPQVAAWGKRWPKQSMGPLGLQSGVPSVSFGDGSTLLDITVQLLVDGAWLDISSSVLYSSGIFVQRGVADEQRGIRPGSMTMTLKNPDRTYSPRNPSSPLFGKIGRNTKIRCFVNAGSGDKLQFTGRVSEWPQRWTTGNDRWVPIVANGALRRLQQGQGRSLSAVERSAIGTGQVVYMWPFTDASGAISMGTIVGNAPMNRLSSGADAVLSLYGLSTGVALASVEGPFGLSGPFPELVLPVDSGSGVAEFTSVGLDPTLTDSSWTIDFILRSVRDDSGLTVNSGPIQWTTTLSESGPYEWNFTFVNNLLTLSGLSELGGGVTISASVPELVDGGWHSIRVSADSNVAYISVDGLLIDFDSNSNFEPFGGINGITVYSYDETAIGHLDSQSIGEITIYSDSLFNVSDAFSESLFGHMGELAVDRFARLCAEEGIDYIVEEVEHDEQDMGFQRTGTLIDLLQECAEVVYGRIDEDLEDRVRLTSRTRRWNREARLTIPYSTANIDQGFEPTDDDRYVRNEWTVRNPSGSSSHVEQADGPLNISDPEDDPQGVGRYSDSVSVNTGDFDEFGNPDQFRTDSSYQHASIRVASGTVDEIRIQTLPIEFATNPDLLPAWLAEDPIGMRILITDPPLELGTGPLDQVVDGYRLRFDQFTYHVDANTSPNKINVVGVFDSNFCWDSNGTTVNEAVDTTETGIDVVITDNCSWVHVSDYDIDVGGETMTVTAVGAVTGGPYPATQFQTLTVVRSVNGIVKTHDIGEEVHVHRRFIWAL